MVANAQIEARVVFTNSYGATVINLEQSNGTAPSASRSATTPSLRKFLRGGIDIALFLVHLKDLTGSSCA